MSSLADRDWLPHYTPDQGDLVKDFYVPALACATRYDRTTGFFTAPALALALRGLEGLIINGGHMRLLVGCTLDEAEVCRRVVHGLHDTLGYDVLALYMLDEATGDRGCGPPDDLRPGA